MFLINRNEDDSPTLEDGHDRCTRVGHVSRVRGRGISSGGGGGGTDSLSVAWKRLWDFPPPDFGILTASDLASINYRPLFSQYLMNRSSKREHVK